MGYNEIDVGKLIVSRYRMNINVENVWTDMRVIGYNVQLDRKIILVTIAIYINTSQ